MYLSVAAAYYEELFLVKKKEVILK